MAENSRTAPGMASGITYTAGAANDMFTAGDGNDAITAGRGGDRVSGDGPLHRQWTYRVYSHDLITAPNQTGQRATGTLLGTGYVDAFNVPALRNSLTGAAQGRNQDDFGVLYQSTLNIQTTGTYTFSTTSDHGSRIILRDASGAVVHDLDNDRDQAAHPASSSVTLQAGQTYAIEVYTWENAGSSVFSATIAGPNFNPTDLATSPLVGTPPTAAGHVDGNDRLSGQAGNDTIAGGETLIGATEADALHGGEGNDSRDAGVGEDSLYCGDVSGTLDLSGYSWGRVRLVYESSDPQSGTVTFFNPNGVSMGKMSFSEIETVIPCFTTGTLIETPTGPRPVESLRPGDLVLTLDDGPQPVRWIGQRRLGLADLMADPSLMPIEIGANALGRGCPRQAVNVSPRHRVLFAGAACELWFGAEEVLVPAKQLVGHGRITRRFAPVTYVHLMFDRHQIVQTHGMWSESYQPVEAALSAMPDLQREEILRLFPTLTTGDAYPAARMTLRPFETRVLLSA